MAFQRNNFKQPALAILAMALLFGCTQESQSSSRPSPATKTPAPNTNNGNPKTPTTPTSQCLAITNGVRTDAMPAIVMLDVGSQGSFCTGFFVSPTTLITAAHCVQPGAINGQLAVHGTGVQAIRAYHMGASGEDVSTVKGDFAVVTFPPGAAPASLKIATRRPVAGDPITIIGYGDTIVNASNSQQLKYSGQNKVYLTSGDGILTYGEDGKGITSAPGTSSETGNGDSGGPVLINGSVVGSVSMGNPIAATNIDQMLVPMLDPGTNISAMKTAALTNPNLAWDLYVDLTAPTHMAYLKSLVSQGVAIDFDCLSQ